MEEKETGGNCNNLEDRSDRHNKRKPTQYRLHYYVMKLVGESVVSQFWVQDYYYYYFFFTTHDWTLQRTRKLTIISFLGEF